MKDLLIRIAQALVDNPEQVRVTEIKAAQEIVLELRVAKNDMGKIIGKQGRNVKALRTILSAVSAKAKNAQCSKSSTNRQVRNCQ